MQFVSLYNKILIYLSFREVDQALKLMKIGNKSKLNCSKSVRKR